MITPSTESKKVLKDRFVLEEVLGRGGMGTVYKALDLLAVEARDKDPYLAIKLLKETLNKSYAWDKISAACHFR
ncbi:hypothetical protein [Methylomicrobium album]|uniref:hypothetical protein n=1 Tax=Methylomicrobium album TaxID=39775 RepID=UPI00020D8585|nr:hypothetical protein [Methylomicrobium album]